jgi:hypothetical protein
MACSEIGGEVDSRRKFFQKPFAGNAPNAVYQKFLIATIQKHSLGALKNLGMYDSILRLILELLFP